MSNRRQKSFDIFVGPCYVHNSRITAVLLGGATAGVLRLTGLSGLLFYFAAYAVAAVAIIAKTGGRPTLFFRKPIRSNVYIKGIASRGMILPYLLSWVLFSALSSPF